MMLDENVWSFSQGFKAYYFKLFSTDSSNYMLGPLNNATGLN